MFSKLIKEIKDLNKKQNIGFKEFIIRFTLFISIITLISTILPYYKEWLSQPYYSTNGGFFKFMFSFILIIFLIAHKEKINNTYSYKNKIKETLVYSILAILSFSIPFTFLSSNLGLHPIVSNYFLYSSGIIFIALAIFNSTFLFKYMQEETLKLLLVIIGYLAIPIILENFWALIFFPIKAGINVMSMLLSGQAVISHLPEEIGFFVHLKDFRVGVGPACSGIQSITAFSILFASAVILLKQDKTLNKLNILKIYIIGTLTLYFVNIIRVIVLIYIGAYISREIAINLFHEYFSSIFFLTFFLYFIKKYSYKFFYEKNECDKINAEITEKEVHGA